MKFIGGNVTTRNSMKATAPAWSSFTTGKNPGKHGVFGFTRLSADHKSLRLASSTDRKAEDLWEIMSAQGSKVAVIRVPVTYPIRRVNGILVSGFMTPPGVIDYIHPASLKDEIEREIGQLIPTHSKFPAKMDLESVTAATTRPGSAQPANKIRLGLLHDSLSRYRRSAAVQHRFWHLTDRNHPSLNLDKFAK